uniref:Uncharacterized protein n=1 Tax=Monodelphis domestica TaxID=13616 RepID=A0A5F8GKI2_MONDO
LAQNHKARISMKAILKGFFVAVSVAATFFDRVTCVARVEGALMQPSLNPGRSQSSDVHGDIKSLVSPKNPEQKTLKQVISLEGGIIKTTIGHKNRYRHSFGSNAFRPVSLRLLHAGATHILWPPERWQRLEPILPPERAPLEIEEK